jgi:hypothetical protein
MAHERAGDLEGPVIQGAQGPESMQRSLRSSTASEEARRTASDLGMPLQNSSRPASPPNGRLMLGRVNASARSDLCVLTEVRRPGTTGPSRSPALGRAQVAEVGR